MNAAAAQSPKPPGASVGGYTLIAEVGPARATVITYVNPAVAVLLGVTLLGEPLTWSIALGFALILGGSVLATRGSRTTAVAEPALQQYWS